ncbi:hypothetical protein GN244_ATG08345 [Phytophthora infestans]|nr:hypothetical protein GN244_ATG08345 [Phytophthora infestans]
MTELYGDVLQTVREVHPPVPAFFGCVYRIARLNELIVMQMSTKEDAYTSSLRAVRALSGDWRS